MQYQQRLREALDIDFLQSNNEEVKNTLSKNGQEELQQDQAQGSDDEHKELADGRKHEAYDMIQSIKNNHQNELIRITKNNLPNESDNEQFLDTEDDQAQVVCEGKKRHDLNSSLESSDYERAALQYQNEYEHLAQLQNQILDDQEEGNETENEVIRDHLQAIIDANPRHANAISALKGLESDLETIFETDLESNYVTTARTNLSTKKLLQQANHLHAHGSDRASQERMHRILTTQFSPIAHSGTATQHNSGSKQAVQTLKDYSSVPVQNPQKGPKPSLQNKVSMKADLSEHVSPDHTASGPDTSRSALISARSSRAQPVKSSGAVALHPSAARTGSTDVLSPTGYGAAQNKQCFFTHQELEDMGKHAAGQSQLDMEERRIRVYTGTTNTRTQGSDKSARKSSSTKRRGQRKSITQPEPIQEAGSEEEEQDLFEQEQRREATTVDILKGIRQNLKTKFEQSA